MNMVAIENNDKKNGQDLPASASQDAASNAGGNPGATSAASPNNESFPSKIIDLFLGKRHGHLGADLYQGRGAELFDAITQSDTYPSHGEAAHIDLNAGPMANLVESVMGDPKTLISIGPGPVDAIRAKELRLAKEIDSLEKVKFIELSQKFNVAAHKIFARTFRKRNVSGSQEDFTEDIDIGPSEKPLVVSFGSLLSNIPNAPTDRFPAEELAEQLRNFKKYAGSDGMIVIGYDTTDIGPRLTQAYQTKPNEEFVKEFLNRIPDICIDPEAFDPEKFNHKVTWHPESKHLAHIIESVGYQSFKVKRDDNDTDGVEITIQEGQEFIVISSVKPPHLKIIDLGNAIGLETENIYTDKNGLALHVFSVKPSKTNGHKNTTANALTQNDDADPIQPTNDNIQPS